MKLLIDMNLAPAWVEVFIAAGWEATHWTSVGDPRASDSQIMEFARASGWVVFTHDLDFGTLLAHTKAGRPSVFQVRTRDVSPDHLRSLVVRALRQFESRLEEGALITLDEAGYRVRLLPLKG